MEEIKQRLINIELKIDHINNLKSENTPHPDQWFGNKTFSQHGEDLFILSLFYRLSIFQPSYLDIGAHHPYNISNTCLMYQKGCRGLNIEANPNLFQEFEKFRPEDINLNIGISNKSKALDFFMIDNFSGRNTFDKESAIAFVTNNPEFKIEKIEKIETYSINNILSKYLNNVWPDFLSIDVEGFDELIIRDMKFVTNKPKIICIETVDKHGNFKKSLSRYLIEIGYFLIAHMGGNSIYIDKSLKKKIL